MLQLSAIDSFLCSKWTWQDFLNLLHLKYLLALGNLIHRLSILRVNVWCLRSEAYLMLIVLLLCVQRFTEGIGNAWSKPWQRIWHNIRGIINFVFFLHGVWCVLFRKGRADISIPFLPKTIYIHFVLFAHSTVTVRWNLVNCFLSACENDSISKHVMLKH